MANPTIEKHEFQAEIAQLLDLVVHSLYTDKEIFIRELVSNAADASEKLRFLKTSGTEIADADVEPTITVATDETAKTITITDAGIGMTHDELIENLGTIAHSGSKAFLQQLKDKSGDGKVDATLIGQFGVGFYSAFMVAEKVVVFSKSHIPGEQGWMWTSDGRTGYEIEPADDLPRGTKVVVHLKEADFASEWRAEGIIKRYSNFVSFPIVLNGKPVNTVQAIWTRSKSEVKAEEYDEFYKYQSHDTDAPHYRLHFTADAPLSIRALLFAPAKSTELLTMRRDEDHHVDLYCKKVLIAAQAKGLFPDWLRFLRGVVDSEDLPLNVSRETMQDSALLGKLRDVLVKRWLKFLDEEAKADAEKYAVFFREHGHCLKEGASIEWGDKRDAIAKLLRFDSSAVEAGTAVRPTCRRREELTNRCVAQPQRCRSKKRPGQRDCRRGPRVDQLFGKALHKIVGEVEAAVISACAQQWREQERLASEDQRRVEPSENLVGERGPKMAHKTRLLLAVGPFPKPRGCDVVTR